ncbi:cysteine peptidase C11 family protein [Dyadobacter jiangsuensis]|uniref:Cysteine peptidase C11 family protein n=2 Tax=Dyadobacter jiangsuensis TaxID=1591085 RepID=A0A2P8G0G7_9BACT|nr:cysteine peptidase C11 family protein [Dyadobacter jiangsuensis]
MSEQMKATLNSLFKDLLTTALDPKRARMFVIMNSIDYHNAQNDTTNAKTLLYQISNPHNLDSNQITNCEVIDSVFGTTKNPDPKNRAQKPREIQAILTKHVKLCPDEEVFFITWDHGSSFGIFREVDAGLPTPRRPIHEDLDRYPYLAHFWDIALKKEDPAEQIKLGELSNTLTIPDLYQIGHTLCSGKPHVVDDDLPTRYNELRRGHEKEYNFIEIGIVKSQEGTGGIVTIQDSTNVREILSNEELASLLAGWLNISCNITDTSVLNTSKKVGVLLMMNCWMMNLHTMYSLRNAVKYLVAPQGSIDTPGYNYKAILKYLFKERQTTLTAKKLAIKCVKSSETRQMRKKSRELRGDGLDMIDQWKILAVDLQRKNENGESVLIENIKKIGDVVEKLEENASQNPELKHFFTALRLISHDFTKSSSLEEPGFMVDIINWLELLRGLSIFNPPYQPFQVFKNRPVLHEIYNLIEAVSGESKKNPLVLAETSGKNIFINAYVVALRPSGYSLFFPNSLTTNQNLIDNVKNDSLLKDFVFWKRFIKSVYPEKIWRVFFN